jgi:glycosyltransferase involved in cell wall biosynthesis
VGDERVASARLQGWVIHRELRARGIDSRVLNDPAAFDVRLRWKAPRRWREALLRRRRVLVFQKVESSRAVKLARLARRVGTKVVFAQTDPRESPLYAVADVVVASSRELARSLASRCPAPIEVIEDSLEYPRELRVEPSDRREGLRLLWVGHRFNFPALEPLRALLSRPENADLELLTLSDHPEASRRWSPEAVEQAMRESDLAVVPSEENPKDLAKSNNRLTLFMGVGLPVVATPLPSYREVVTHGRDALLAREPEEWARALRDLRDPKIRRKLGAAARETAWSRFAPDLVADRWQALFCRLVPGAAKRGAP